MVKLLHQSSHHTFGVPYTTWYITEVFDVWSTYPKSSNCFQHCTRPTLSALCCRLCIVCQKCCMAHQNCCPSKLMKDYKRFGNHFWVDSDRIREVWGRILGWFGGWIRIEAHGLWGKIWVDSDGIGEILGPHLSGFEIWKDWDNEIIYIYISKI